MSQSLLQPQVTEVLSMVTQRSKYFPVSQITKSGTDSWGPVQSLYPITPCVGSVFMLTVPGSQNGAHPPDITSPPRGEERHSGEHMYEESQRIRKPQKISVLVSHLPTLPHDSTIYKREKPGRVNDFCRAHCGLKGNYSSVNEEGGCGQRLGDLPPPSPHGW